MYSAFLHFINNYGLHQYVNNPTRGDKILDIVLSSSDSLVNDMQVTAPFSTNDHNSVVFNVNGNEEDASTSSGNFDAFYDYARANKEGLRNFLGNVKWDNIFQYCFTVDACCEAFYDVFITLLSYLYRLVTDRGLILSLKVSGIHDTLKNLWPRKHSCGKSGRLYKYLLTMNLIAWLQRSVIKL